MEDKECKAIIRSPRDTITMKKIIRPTLPLLLALALSTPCLGQGDVKRSTKDPFSNLVLPLKVSPVQLSGNFAELRTGHFHSGVDFRTNEVEGKPIIAIADGYVSRIAVATGGYGKVLYVNHPTQGTTSVYAHLQRFDAKIERYVRSQQMKQEHWAINLYPAAGQFPVKQGEQIALSGNSGSSAGPHLHFEIRDAATEHPLNSHMPYLKYTKDNMPPLMHSLLITPLDRASFVEQQPTAHITPLTLTSQSTYIAKDTIAAYGTVGIALRGHDVMNDTHNTYGYHQVRMWVDDRLYFEVSMNHISFDRTRYINSFIDYGTMKSKKGWFQKLYKDPGCPLDWVKTYYNDASIEIEADKYYKIDIEVIDDHGNASIARLTLKGMKPTTEQHPITDVLLMPYDQANQIAGHGVTLDLPRGSLYRDEWIGYHSSPQDSRSVAPYHALGKTTTPLHSYCPLSIAIEQPMTHNAAQYGIVHCEGKETSWVGGKVAHKKISGKVREFGVYTVMIDSVKPKIIPRGTNKQWNAGLLAFTLTDKLSGIASYRATLDGAFILMEEYRSGRINGSLSHIKRTGRSRTLRLVVKDRAGLTTTFERKMKW